MDILEYESYHEKKSHGSELFAYNTYLCSIPLDFSSVPDHWHDEMEIIYVKKGCMTVNIDFTAFCACAGSILFLIPGQIHSMEQYPSSSAEYETILFKPEILISQTADICSDYFHALLNGAIEIPAHLTPDMPYYGEIASCLDRADEICQTCPNAYQLFIKGQLLLLFFALFSKCSDLKSRPKNKKSLIKIKSVIKFIESNYMQKITIEDMADLVSLSQSHFMKFFKNTMGTTFIDYLNHYRLTMASRLLLTSDATVLNIASATGFESLSYFNRLFKKRFGMTPKEFRNRPITDHKDIFR